MMVFGRRERKEYWVKLNVVKYIFFKLAVDVHLWRVEVDYFLYWIILTGFT